MRICRFRSFTSQPPPALFTVPVFAYAIVPGSIAGWSGIYGFTSAVVAVHGLVYLLPWRVPRGDRTVKGYWFETLACAAPLATGAIAWAVLDPRGALLGAPLTGRLLAGLAGAPFTAGFLIWFSGINLRALRSGDLAFLAGPLPAHRAAARIFSVIVAIFAEEVIFRAVPAGLSSYATLALAAGAAAFVSGHHMVRGSGERWSWRIIRYEVAAAVLFAALIVMSGSVWPAIAAHALTNVPQVVLDIGRALPGQTSEVAS